jgi:hypothetical protein
MIMERSWFWRRWAIFSTCGFCMIVIGYSMIFADDTSIARDIVGSAFLLLGATVQGYIFGPIIDDRFKGKEKLASQAVDQSEPTETNVEIKS